MVNTFITLLPTENGYLESARTLDLLRLRKQCVEAYQILNAITDLFTVASFLSIPFPSITLPDLSAIDQWVSEVKSKYKQLDYYYIIQAGKFYQIPKNGVLFSLVKTDYISGKTYFLDGNNIRILLKPAHYRQYYDKNYDSKARVEKILSRTNVLITEDGDRIIKLAWINHPAARQWIGYENALKLYINNHLDAYTERTGKPMCIRKYNIPAEIQHPWWVSEFYIMSNRCALMRKEIARSEKPHYIHSELFQIPDKYKKLGYLWPSKLSVELVNKLQNGTFDPQMFGDINNDDVDI